VTIVFVTHKLEEVMALCDVVTVLRDSRLIGTQARAEAQGPDHLDDRRGTTSRWRGTLPVERKRRFWRCGVWPATCCGPGPALAEIMACTAVARAHRAGQDDHRRIPDDGRQYPGQGEPARIGSVANSLHRFGIGYVSEAAGGGLIAIATVATNLTITVWQRLAGRLPRLLAPRRRSTRPRLIRALDIKTPGPPGRGEPVGGNQQKVSIGKWLVADCDILILDEPTVGVDVGAKEYLHDLIWKMAKEEGKSVILISSDMPELVELSRRILVFKNYAIVGELTDLNEGERAPEETSMRIGRFLA
jgi:ribose transport system ATP-binding protein